MFHNMKTYEGFCRFQQVQCETFKDPDEDVKDPPVEGSVGGLGPPGGSRAQCRFLLNSCWSSV